MIRYLKLLLKEVNKVTKATKMIFVKFRLAFNPTLFSWSAKLQNAKKYAKWLIQVLIGSIKHHFPGYNNASTTCE